MTTISDIHAGIRTWEELIDFSKLNCETEQIIDHLNQAFCFSMTPRDIEKCKDKEPESVHVYMALREQELKFTLIDSESDKALQTNTENIIATSISQAASAPITFHDVSQPVPPFCGNCPESDFKLLSD